MTGCFTLSWRIEPTTPPCPIRHCRSCGGTRPFRSSGKVRLNANGRLLDAWLVYKCCGCDATWNLPLMERVALGGVAEADLQAMHLNDMAWVRLREADLALLGRFTDRIDLSPEVTLKKSAERALPEDWTEIELVVQADCGAGPRLDRLLAKGLALSRAEVVAMHQAGGLQIAAGAGKALRKPVSGNIRLRFLAAGLTTFQRVNVATGLLA